jgi:vWA found in TerF C terminus
MGISLEKHTQAAKVVLDKFDIKDVRAQVDFIFDKSGSADWMYDNSTMQLLCDRGLGIGMNIDIDKSIGVYAFANSAKKVGTVTEGNHLNFIQKHFKNLGVGGSTYYAPPMKLIMNEEEAEEQVEEKQGFFSKLFGKKKEEPKQLLEDNKVYPRIVFFCTDGQNWDQELTASLIKQYSDQPVFWQFMGIGAPEKEFTFLKNLSDITGRVVDNAGFYFVEDIVNVTDDELYNGMLNEFPQWLKAAAAKGII